MLRNVPHNTLRLVVLGILVALYLGFSGALAQQVQITMQVGSTITPALVSLDPSTQPVLVNLGGSRTVNFEVNPSISNNPLTWTATVIGGTPGSVGPMSGIIDTTQGTTGYFDYLGPSTPGPATVLLTLTDSANPSANVYTQQIQFYTF